MLATRHYGLVLAGDRLDMKFEMSIYLDGQDVTHRCQCADDILQFVVLYTTRPPTRDRVTGKPQRELLFGDVQIFACDKEP